MEEQLEFEFEQDPESGDFVPSQTVEFEFDEEDLEDEHYENLADKIDEERLEEIGSNAVEAYESDLQSRKGWETLTSEAIENLGLITDDANEPFEGACMATHPLILESVVKFQSKASNELLPAEGPVLTKILGKATEELEDIAQRIKTDMNFELQEVIEEYYSETEKTLFFTALLGNGFKRKYRDPIKKRTCDEMCFPDKLVVNNLAKSLSTAERISFLTYIPERLMEQYQATKYYSDVDLGEPGGVTHSEFSDLIREIQGIESDDQTHDEVYEVIEQHCYLKLFDDEFPRPYVIHVEKETQKVISVRRNWRENDSTFQKLQWFTHYGFVPTAGFYCLGYAQLIGNLQKCLTVAMRSLVDAGQLANMQAGFKNSNAKIVGDNGPLAPGEFRDIEVPPGITNVQEIFFPLPFKEPSVVLFQLFEKLEASGQKFADSTEQVIADSTNYGPVGTTMALLEASTRFFASVYKRMYLAQASELKIIKRMIEDYGSESYSWMAGDNQDSRKQDYNQPFITILPVADPNYSSQAQRLSKAQSMLDTALKTPQEHDMKSILREFHKALGNDNVDRFVPSSEEAQRLEPLQDLEAVVKGKPIAAFPDQEHEAHITVKQAWLESPFGSSEVMAQFRAPVMANIQEHMFMVYQTNIKALEQQGLSVAQAAERLNRLNQIAEEEAQKGSPAAVLAQAEMLKAQVDAMKEEREARNDNRNFGLKLMDTATKAEREANRASEKDRDQDLREEEMGLDLIKKGLEESARNDK